jgi:pantoate--beta-alanine ligase
LFLIKGIDFVKNIVKNEFNNNEFLNLEYFEIADIETLTPTTKIVQHKKYRAFIASFAGEVRLIDNIALN